MLDDEWAVQDEAIIEQPRNVRRHPLLNRIYKYHDELISQYLPTGQVLEVAFGRYMHPSADIGIEAWLDNVAAAGVPAVVGDGRSLPFASGSFDAVIGRRFLHHVAPTARSEIVAEAARLLRPGGRIVLPKGRPGCTAGSQRDWPSASGYSGRTPISTSIVRIMRSAS